MEKDIEAITITIWNDIVNNLKYANIHVWIDGATETKEIESTIDWNKKFTDSGRLDIVARAISLLTASLSEKIVSFAKYKNVNEIMVVEPLMLEKSYILEEHRDCLTAKLVVGVE